MVKKYGDLYLDARKILLQSEPDLAAFVAKELLSKASGKSIEQILSDRDLYASEEIAQELDGYLARYLAHEPLAYILGEWDFCGLRLDITPDVLIPRDDTMAVTELAFGAINEMPGYVRVLDLCTGSGCIALAIANYSERTRVTGCDISKEAIRIAKINAKKSKLSGRCTFLEMDVNKEPPDFLGLFDIITANPPYVTREEMELLEPSVRFYEPRSALFGGEDGLDFYREIVRNYSSVLRPFGYICLEFGFGQGPEVEKIVSREFSDVKFSYDTRGVERALIARRRPTFHD